VLCPDDPVSSSCWASEPGRCGSDFNDSIACTASSSMLLHDGDDDDDRCTWTGGPVGAQSF